MGGGKAREDAVGAPGSRLPFLVMTKSASRPRARKVGVAVAPLQFRVWSVGGSADGDAAAAEPSDDELLTSRPHADSLRVVVAHLITIGHFIGGLPAPTSDAGLKFRWTSVFVCFSVLVLSAVVGRITVYLYCVYVGYMSAFETLVSTRLGFHVLATLEFAMYLRLASQWRVFVLCFLRVERRQGPVLAADGRPPPLRRQMVAFTCIMVVLSVVEVVLMLTTAPLSRDLSEFTSVAEVLEDHYYSVYNHVAMLLPYSGYTLFAAEFTTTVTNLILNYNDVFLFTVIVLIVRRFHALRTRLARAARQKHDVAYWQSAREAYHDLSQLTRDVDGHLNPQLLLSCLNNFFSLCIQVQHTVRCAAPAVSMARRGYFLFSSTFVLLRSAAVVLAASSIPEESKALKRALFAVPSGQYTDEIHRFLSQVTSDDITLTGMGLFTITRSFILTMLGTIATYEIVLVQMYKTS